MFCPKCGEKINDDATFCAHCGHKMNEKENSTTNENNFEAGKEKFSKMLSSAKKMVNTGMNKLGESVSNSQTLNDILGKIKEILGIDPLFYVVSLATMFFATLFMFFTTYNISVNFFGESFKASIRESGAYNAIFIVNALICLGGLVATALPLVAKKKLDKIHMLPSQICYIVAIVVLLFLRIYLALQLSDAGSLVKCHLNFAGWLFCVFAVASIVLSLLVASKMPKTVKNFDYYNKLYATQNNTSNQSENSQNSQNPQNPAQ